MFVIAAVLLGLIALLATLQYQWLGRVSDAERERLTASLNARATALAQDFDRELTLAYMLFQFDPFSRSGEPRSEESLPARLANHHERWQTTARYPKLIKECLIASGDGDTPVRLERFNAGTRFVEPIDWPAALLPIRTQIAGTREQQTTRGTFVVRTIAAGLWEDVPAIVVPSAATPLLFLNPQPAHPIDLPSSITYTILVLDREYIAREMLPALADHHFRGTGDGFDYQLAIVKATGNDVVYHSTAEFTPKPDANADATAELFQVRTQEFPQLVADVRRFTALAAPPGSTYTSAQTVKTFRVPRGEGRPASATRQPQSAARGQIILRDMKPMSVIVEQTATTSDRAAATAIGRTAAGGRWRLLVKHPAGSLEAAVNSARRKNLLISSSILGILAASMVMIVVSTRRSQELARQQMEFVAAVSHELRTPLAVVRSAGDNLADGVVHDQEQVRKYGALVRSEGRRLTEMVEQILEFAGIHSGQRMFNISAVRVDRLIDRVLAACETLIEAARLRVEVDIPADLPPVAGDESALRRVFQNLIGNAIKYGADGGWIGVAARRAGSEVRITVSDRGIGISPADQERIFEPFYRAADVVAAQVQGAGLGLSLVHRIVAAHGGRITLQSAKAAGSEFTVHLPVGAGSTAGRTDEVPHGSSDLADPATPAPHTS
jgi:two-component system, OmpR family, sensor histidine kinase SenX3